MSFNKKFFTTGGIVASTPPSGGGAFDPLQNFETVTYTGNGSTQKITGYIRKGAAFSGSSKVSFTSPIETTNTDFSISLWFNLSSAFSSGNQTILGSDSNVAPPALIRLSYVSTNSYRIITERSYGSGIYYSSSSGYSASTINPNTWYHLVVTYDASDSSRAIIYLDKAIQNNKNLTSLANETVTSSQALGQYRNNAIQGFNGKIDQVRIFNRALDETTNGEVTTLYNETYASSTKSTTDIFGDGSGIALYELDDDAYNSDFEQAAVFNGSSSEIVAPNSLLPSSGGFSISWWQKTTQADNTYSYTMDNSGGSAQNGIYIITHNVSTGFIVGFKNSSTFGSASIPYSSVERTQWTHFCISWDGTTSTDAFKIYKNNVPTSFTSSVTNGGGSYPFRIGRSYNGTDWFGGSIDQVRIYSSALDSTDVEKLYKESADVPTSNLVAHYKLDGDATDETETYDGTASNVTYSAGVYGGTPTNVNFLGMAFKPDLVWIKDRDNSNPHELSDSVRGVSGTLNTNNTNAEYINASFQITSLDTNGFTVVDDSAGNYAVNGNGIDYVAWCWKAADTTTTIAANTVGNTIASDVRANIDAGFSIVKYTGNGISGATIAHGLGDTPTIIIAKSLGGGTNWCTQFPSVIGAGNSLFLNSNVVVQNHGAGQSDRWTTTLPTSSVFSIGGSTELNDNGVSVVAYCFHSVDEYQKVGSYSGGQTLNTDNIVDFGFTPRFVIVKNITAATGWLMIDSIRPNGYALFANDSGTEADYSGHIKLSSSGLRFDGNNNNVNASGNNYIYLAIA